MPKTTVASWDTTAGNNTDLNSINIGEGWASADFNNAIREMMAQIKTWYGTVTADGTIAGSTTGSDTTLTLDSADDSILVLDKAASGDGAYIYGKTAGVNRWVIQLGDAEAEVADAGSDFRLNPFKDDGSSNGVSLVIERKTHKATFTGAVYCDSLTETSDRKLKTDLQRIEGALDKVDVLTGYTFTRIDSGARQTGLIAQDVQVVLPEAVTDNDGTLGLAYGNLAGLLVEAIKELRAEVEALKERLA